MQYKLKLINRIFPSTLKHSSNKSKKKVFIIYSNNTKLNWILFRNIIVRAHYHFKLNPQFFITDSFGFVNIDSDVDLLDINPYNPTFNILTYPNYNMQKEEIVHNDIEGIRYSIWWEHLKDYSGRNTNLLLYTDNKKELEKIINCFSVSEWLPVVFNIYTSVDKQVDTNCDMINISKKTAVWNIKYNKKATLEWENVSLIDTIKKMPLMKKHKKIKSIRNKIFTIMNSYYLNPIIPSYYNDEDKFESSEKDRDQVIDTIYK